MTGSLRILTFQEHPEYTLPYIEHIVDIAPHVQEQVKDVARATLDVPIIHSKETAHWMLFL